MAHFGVAVGIDLVQISRVEAALQQFPQRFLRRLYTEHEVAYCTASPPAAAERLAARFAAKEAALKVLRPGGVGVGWRSIEVRRAEPGFAELALHGTARELAEAAGLGGFALSMSHEGDYATAVVIATRSAPASGAEADPQQSAASASSSRSQGEQLAMSEQIRAILREHGRLALAVDSLSDEQDLYKAGLTSQASVSVMLALEGAFDIEFPDHMLKRSVFASISAMRRAVEELTARAADSVGAAAY